MIAPPDRSDRLDAAIAAYLETRARGEAPDTDAWIALHPDLADDLAAFLADERRFFPPAEPETSPMAAPEEVFPRPFGDFILLARLGQGGMGIVYEARQKSLDRVVALKMLSGPLLHKPVERHRFLKEAHAIARFDHAQIVPIHDVDVCDGRPYFTMKRVASGSLADHLGRFLRVPRAAARLVADAARGIHHAHQRGVLHRDLKPSNILMDGDRPLVADFGLAKFLADDPDLTDTGAILGSPSYMAPEQAEGRLDAVTTQTDVHGLGTILYALLTGAPPFRASNPSATLEQVRLAEPKSPRKLNPLVDGDLATICLKCLEKEPPRRYASADALADDLSRWLDGRPIRARRTGPFRRLAKWTRRHPLPAGLILTLVAMGLSGITIGLLQYQAVLRARDAAYKANDELESSLYSSRIILADREVDAGNIVQSELYLDQCPPRLRGWEWGFLKHRKRMVALRTDGGKKGFANLAYSPDGNRLAILEDDEQVKHVMLIDSTTRGKVWSVPSHKRDILTAIAFRPDGRQIASASCDSTARARSSADGAESWNFETSPRSRLYSVAYSPDSRLVAFGSVKLIHVVDATTGVLQFSLEGHKDLVRGLAFAGKDGSTLASASDDGTMKFWDLTTRSVKTTIGEGSLIPIHSLAVSRDGNHLAAGTAAGMVIFVDQATRRERGRIAGHHEIIRSIAFDPTGRRLATGGDDQLLKVWDVERMRELLSIKGHEKQVFGLAFRPDGAEIATGDETTARWWIARPPGRGDEGETQVIGGHSALVTNLAYSPDGRLLATASHDKTVVLHDAETGTPQRTLSGPTGALLALAYRPDSKQVAAAGYDRVARAWDLPSGRLAFSRVVGDRPVSSLAYSPDGRILATGDWDGKYRMWDVASGDKLVEGRLTHAVNQIAFDRDGRRVALALANTDLPIYDLSKHNQIVKILKCGRIRVAGAAFSPGGTTLATASDDLITLWNSSDWTSERVFDLPRADYRSVAYSPDGRLLAVGTIDRFVRVLDSATGRQLACFRDAAGPVFHLAFRPDGRRLAATCGDATVRVWDLGAVLKEVSPGSR